MNILKQWPQRVQNYIADICGIPKVITKLNGIKQQGGCYRIQTDDASIIIKEMTKAQEYLFYRECSSLMGSFRNHIPKLYWLYQQDYSYWIVIEDIPYNFPKDRWQADPHQINALFLMHSESWGKELPIKVEYIPKWDEQLTENVLQLFPIEDSHLRNLLEELQKLSQQLFRPHCWINADTNPTNWGIREDGTIVLFDWERISMGSPAIDLGITIPGLGTSDGYMEEIIVKRYLSLWDQSKLKFPLNEKQLLKQIELAKIWSAVEFLGSAWEALEPDILNKISNQLIDKIYRVFRVGDI